MLITRSIAFAPADVLAFLQLQDRGVPKQDITFIGALLMPVDVLVPAFVTKFMDKERPFDIFINLYVPRIVLGVAAWFLVINISMPVDWYEYGAIFLLALVRSVCSGAMFVSMMTLFARVSDKRIGGTYMTLLNTIANLGGNLAQTSCLFAVERLDGVFGLTGYTVLTHLSLVVGIVWLCFFKGIIDYLQGLKVTSWHVYKE